MSSGYIKLHGDPFLEGIARCAVIGKLVARRASVDCTTALLAAYVPCTGDNSAILPSADRGTSTARFKFVGSVEALKIGRETARANNGACSETHGAKLRGCWARFTLPDMAGGVRRRRGGVVGLLFAAHLVVRPFPLVFALRGRRGMRARLVRNAAVVFLAPRPARRRTFFLTRGCRMRRRSASRKATFLFIKPEVFLLAAGFILATLPTAITM